jgi:hypothetical protein
VWALLRHTQPACNIFSFSALIVLDDPSPQPSIAPIEFFDWTVTIPSANL